MRRLTHLIVCPRCIYTHTPFRAIYKYSPQGYINPICKHSVESVSIDSTIVRVDVKLIIRPQLNQTNGLTFPTRCCQPICSWLRLFLVFDCRLFLKPNIRLLPQEEHIPNKIVPEHNFHSQQEVANMGGVSCRRGATMPDQADRTTPSSADTVANLANSTTTIMAGCSWCGIKQTIWGPLVRLVCPTQKMYGLLTPAPQTIWHIIKNGFETWERGNDQAM